MKIFEAKDRYPIELERLPNGWVSAMVGDVCTTVQSGFASGEHNSQGRGVPHLRPMNVDRNGRLDLSEVKHVAPDEDSRRVQRGDVLFNNTNSPVLIGKTCAIAQDGDMAFSNHMTRLRPAEGIESAFLAAQLHYLWMAGFFLHRCVKHVNQASVSTEVLANTVPIVVAPANEQKRIAQELDDYFSRLDVAVATLDRVERNLKRYRSSVLKAAVEGRLVPTEAELARAEKRDYEPASELLKRILVERRRLWEEAELAKMKAAGKTPKDDNWKAKYQEPAAPDTADLPPLPEGWCWATMQQLSSLVTDGDHNPPRRVESGVPHLTAKNIKKWNISFDGCSFVSELGFEQTRTRYEPRAHDVIVTCVGTIGETAVVPTGCIFSADRNLAAVRLIPEGMLPRFLMYALSSPDMRIRLRGASGATAQPHLYLSDLRELVVSVPPLLEQRRLVEHIDKHVSDGEAVGSLAENTRRRCQRLRQGILKWAFEGKLVDQDPSDEPATVLLERIRAERADAESTKEQRRPRRAAKTA